MRPSSSLFLFCALLACAGLLVFAKAGSSPLGATLNPNPSAGAPRVESDIALEVEHARSQKQQIDAAARKVKLNTSSPRPAFKTECQPKPIDFGPYTYCNANYPTAATYKAPAGEGWKLAGLHLLTRHGDRSPVNLLPFYDVSYNFCGVTASQGFFYKKDGERPANGQEGRRLEEVPTIGKQSTANPYARRLWQGDCMNGQLTAFGVQQLQTIGKNLRDIYVDKLRFLPDTYTRGKTSVYVRSTDIWRTRQSAESLLSGLWPARDLANEDVIPLQVFPAELETAYNNPTACPALAKVMSSQWSSAEWKAHLNKPEVWALLDEVLEVGGQEQWHTSFDPVYDNLQTRQCHNLPLPCSRKNRNQCVPQTLADFVYAQGDWGYRFSFNESPLATQRAQLGISAFMSVIRDSIRAIVTGDASRSGIGVNQLAYFSAHDTTVAPVLGFFNVTGMRWPPYASNIVWELWQQGKGETMQRVETDEPIKADPSTFYVRMIYNGVPIPLYAANCCDEMCPYANFMAYMDYMIPNNLPDVCHGAAMQFDQQ